MSLWRRPEIRRLVLVGILAFSSFFLTLSSLPLWAVAGGASEGAAGLVTAVMLISTVATQIIVPAFVRRFGLATTLSIGLIALGGASPFYLISDDLWWLLVVSAIRGIGFAVITVLMPLAATSMVPKRQRGEVIGIYGLAIAVPNLLGVPIGVGLTTAGQFHWVAILGAAPLVALVMVSAFAQVKPHEAELSPSPATAENSGLFKAIIGATLILFTVTLAGGGVFTFLPIVSGNGVIATAGLLIFGLTSAICRWISGVLSDRMGTRILLPSSLIAAGGGMALLALGLGQDSAVLILLGALVMGGGYGAVQNLTLLVAFERAGPARQANASATWNAAFDGGTAVGALAIGLVASAGAGFPWTFVGCAVLIVAMLPLALRAGPVH